MNLSKISHVNADGRSPLPALTYLVLPHIVLAAFLAILPRPPLCIRFAAWAGLTFVLVYAATQFTTEAKDDFDDYISGIFLVLPSATAFVLLFLSDPMVDYRHESIQEGEVIKQKRFVQRMYLSMCIILSYRGIGWNYEVRGSSFKSI